MKRNNPHKSYAVATKRQKQSIKEIKNIMNISLGTLGGLFIALKLDGIIAWDWWLVLLPFYTIIVILLSVRLFSFIQFFRKY